MKVRLSVTAKNDLLEIGLFIAEDSPARADTFVAELETVCLQLGDSAKAFPLLPRNRRTKMRRRTYGDYLIFYVIQTDFVQVARILHGARDYDKILFPK